MKPVSPVIPGKDYEEIVVAENQEEYQNLPAIHIKDDGIMLSRWELSDEEIKKIVETKSIYVMIWTNNRPMQPHLLITEPPELITRADTENTPENKTKNQEEK